MDYINIRLTKDQSRQIVRILDYGKAEPMEKFDDVKGEFVKYYEDEDRKFNKFIERIQRKINKELTK